MNYFLSLIDSDLIAFGFLLIVGITVYLYVRVKRWFGTESDYLGDDGDGDSFWIDSGTDNGGDD